jgi:6-phosphogluconate dehydrogenase
MGIPNTMMSSAVFARYISSFKDTRIKMSDLIDSGHSIEEDLDLVSIEKAYECARLINHQQGFKLMQLASDTYNWDLNFSDIARIWSNGCIIKSHLMNLLHKEFMCSKDLFEMDLVTGSLVDGETALRDTIMSGLSKRISTHCFSAAYYYWVDMTTKNLPANLIQAQRDFFGAHTYQRVDAPESEFYHSNW